MRKLSLRRDVTLFYFGKVGIRIKNKEEMYSEEWGWEVILKMFSYTVVDLDKLRLFEFLNLNPRNL